MSVTNRGEGRVANQTCRIAMIGTSIRAQGGVASVVQGLLSGGLADIYPIDYVETHCDGGSPAKLRVAAKGILRVWGLLLFRKVALLHVHVSSRASFWRKSLLVLPAYLLRKPVLLHLHGAEFHVFYQQESSKFAKRVIRLVLECSSGIVVLSDGWKNWVKETFPDAKVRVIYNPAPLGNLPMPDRSDASNLLFLGKLGRRKGVDDLIKAVSRLAPSSAGIRLILGGDGDVERARELAAQLDIDAIVETPGWVSGEKKRELLSGAAVFVLPSYNEGLPMGVLEAMAQGLPVVSTPVGGIPEAITDGVEGFLVAPGDIGGLAMALDRLLKDSELRRLMGEAARHKAETTFGVDHIIPQWVDLYAEHGVFPATSVPRGDR